MSLTARSPSEFLVTGVPSSPEAGGSAVIVTCEFRPTRPVPVKNTKSLASLMERYEQDAGMARDLAQGRKELAQSLYGGEAAGTLSALRLGAGLSQAQLAQRVGTSQPYIARIESGQTDPGTEAVVRIAQALGVDPGRVFSAIIAERKLRKGNE